MNTIEDLITLERLLAEFEFPVSPILQYAIQEKKEELTAEETVAETAEETISVPEELYVTEETEEEPVQRIKKKASRLRVYRSDGTMIEERKAAMTMAMVIREIGVEKVYALKIPMCGMHLVTIGENPYDHLGQHDIGGGFVLNVHSNTMTKKRQLETIFRELHLNWRVEIVSS